MVEKNIFYVYEHWRPDKDVCFYVGKGKGKRAWSMGGRSKWHTAVVSKLTSLGMCVDVRIVVRDLVEDTAFTLERDRIAFYGRAKLVNLTPGGDGISGHPSTSKGKKRSVATVARMRVAAKKRGVPRSTIEAGADARRIKPRTPHTAAGKELMRLAAIEREAKRRAYDASCSPEERIARYRARATTARRVICLDDGLTYESASLAAQHYGIDKASLNALCLGRRGRKTVRGLRFKYVEAA